MSIYEALFILLTLQMFFGFTVVGPELARLLKCDEYPKKSENEKCYGQKEFFDTVLKKISK